MNLPEGYAPVRAPHAWAFAVDAAVPWLEEVMASGATLHAWAARQADRKEFTGRGITYSVPAPVPGPDGRARWVVRHYYRGGAVARWLGDRYLAVGRPRALKEACAAREARARGIATPAAVAGAVYPAGAFYRADLVTEEIPYAADLAAVVFGDGTAGLDPEPCLTATGRLVRTLERAGLYHPDLNAKNVVLHAADHGLEAHLVDLDRCCVREMGVPAPAFAMRDRLQRSLRKIGRRTGRPLTRAAWKALHSGWDQTA